MLQSTAGYEEGKGKAHLQLQQRLAYPTICGFARKLMEGVPRHSHPCIILYQERFLQGKPSPFQA